MEVEARRSNTRLVVWLVFILLFGALQYAAYFTTDPDERLPENFLYTYQAAVLTLVQFGFMLGIALLIALGASKRELFALRRPTSWRTMVGIGGAVLVGVYVLSFLVGQVLDPSDEQGLLPDRWRSDRVAQYATNFVVVAGFVPIVEELIFRGLGFTLLLRRYGSRVTIVANGLLFASAHGLVEAFPIFAGFGFGLAFLRAKTNSVLPTIGLHAIFNSIAMLAVLTQPSS